MVLTTLIPGLMKRYSRHVTGKKPPNMPETRGKPVALLMQIMQDARKLGDPTLGLLYG